MPTFRMATAPNRRPSRWTMTRLVSWLLLSLALAFWGALMLALAG